MGVNVDSFRNYGFLQSCEKKINSKFVMLIKKYTECFSVTTWLHTKFINDLTEITTGLNNRIKEKIGKYNEVFE